MYRWNAYIGEPLMLDEMLFRTDVSGMEDAPGRYTSSGRSGRNHPRRRRMENAPVGREV